MPGQGPVTERHPGYDGVRDPGTKMTFLKNKKGAGSQRMMLCEPERGHRGEGGEEGAGHNGGAGASHGFSSLVGW